MQKKRIVILLCAAAVLLGLIVWDLAADAQRTEKTYIAMGTAVTAKLTGKDAAAAQDALRETIEGLESGCLSRRIEGSDAARINAEAGAFVSV